MIQPLDTKGLYGDPAWKGNTPGTFAVVIGVSRYPFLDGGTSPARNTYGLPQLVTSALTAYGVFRWLRERYRYTEAPLVRCRLLLAATDAEEVIAAADTEDPYAARRLGEIGVEPTMSNCTDAIVAWRDEMRELARDVAVASRAVFFFSGHGIQQREGALVLPMDWLGDRRTAPSRTISIDNLVNGLASIAVPQQWFFSDACRNSTSELDRIKNMTGEPVLDEDAGTSFERSYPIIYATGRNAQAFEPDDPRKGATFFGAALLDGLHARTADLICCKPPPCRVEFNSFINFVKAETNRRLRDAQVPVGPIGGVMQGGEYANDNPTVTLVPEPREPETKPSTAKWPHIDANWLGRGAPLIRHAPKGIRRPVVRGGDTVIAYKALKTPPRRGIVRAERPVRLAVVSTNLSSNPRARFGSERIAAFFQSTEPAALTPFPDVRRTRDGRRVQATLVFSTTQNRWLQFTDTNGTMFASIVPRTARVVVVTVATDDEHAVIDLAVDSDFTSDVMIHHTYRDYRRLDPSAAASRDARQDSRIREALRRKGNNPSGALEAALILVRTGQFDALYGARRSGGRADDDWLANLAEYYPELGSDACVLVARRLINDPHGDRTDLARVYALIAAIPQRGLPRTDEAMTYLFKLARLAQVKLGSVAPRVAPIIPSLRAINAMVEATRVRELIAETQGQFAIYVATDEATRTALQHLRQAQGL